MSDEKDNNENDGKLLNCSFCGKNQHEVRKLIAGPSVFVCDECVELCNDIIKEELQQNETSDEDGKLPKPTEIKKSLDKYVIGQQQAKKILSVAVYNHYKRLLQPASKDDIEIQKSNIIMVGQTGTGKTLMAKTIAKMLNVPLAIVDATVLTEAGYVGEDVESILTRLLQAADYDLSKAEKGIVFIDEIDKIAGSESSGPDVSREGVQRDILPIIEGSTVSTKYGQVKTDHVLFIAAGAFHVSKPSDLIPELQGRFPIRVEMNNLNKSDFIKILTKPKNALITQYIALLESEGVELTFHKDAIKEIAAIATELNEQMENIGARRLHTVMTSLLEDILFQLPDSKIKKVKLDKKLVREKLSSISEDEDLRRYIL